MKLFVANLSYGVTSEELQAAFEECGNVKSAQVVTDRDTGRSRGFGFVEMSSQEEAQSAMKNLNGRALKGREILVKPADNKPPRRSAHEG
ncbi:MAG: RNA-binding protein [Verrucomicrobia bacterium]|nr:RNA-binding protein [Verrucomicrobiota bacterium]MBS0645728.1 RNA-binding protein [Verrucomicrobiota bacterium]